MDFFELAKRIVLRDKKKRDEEAVLNFKIPYGEHARKALKDIPLSSLYRLRSALANILSADFGLSDEEIIEFKDILDNVEAFFQIACNKKIPIVFPEHDKEH